jgi:hypothetical protein
MRLTWQGILKAFSIFPLAPALWINLVPAFVAGGCDPSVIRRLAHLGGLLGDLLASLVQF